MKINIENGDLKIQIRTALIGKNISFREIQDGEFTVFEVLGAYDGVQIKVRKSGKDYFIYREIQQGLSYMDRGHGEIVRDLKNAKLCK